MYVLRVSFFLFVIHTVSINGVDFEKITYMAFERANVTYYNTKYLDDARASARRYSRSDPVYYFNFNFTTHVPIGNNFSIDIYFYEWLTNQYKRSFVEMHFRLCNMVNNSNFFGFPLRKAFKAPCPFPPGQYILPNMTVPIEAIPRTFPFTKGRMYCNVTSVDTGELVGSGYTDMELRTMKRQFKNN